MPSKDKESLAEGLKLHVADVQSLRDPVTLANNRANGLVSSIVYAGIDEPSQLLRATADKDVWVVIPEPKAGQEQPVREEIRRRIHNPQRHR